MGDKIEFVFYGVFMEKQKWNRTLEKYGLKGKRHLLTNDQLAFFKKYFGIYGFQHH